MVQTTFVPKLVFGQLSTSFWSHACSPLFLRWPMPLLGYPAYLWIRCFIGRCIPQVVVGSVLFISLSIHIYIYVYTQSTVWLYIRRVAQVTFRFDNHAAWFETFRKRLKLRKLSGAVPNYPKAVRNRFELLESCPELLPS